MGTEIEKTVATDIVVSDQEQALADEIRGDVDQDDIVLPQLKLAQGQTGAVTKGLADPGEFVIELTGDSFGEQIDFVVADHFKGRFWGGGDGKGRGARGDTVPWTEHPCYGQLFVDCPDAEEQYSAAVNNGEKPWGKGPDISTTTNFVGFVAGNPVPVFLSLMRTNVPAARKLLTFVSRLSKAPWDNVYVLSSVSRQKGSSTYHVIEVDRGRPATQEERQTAVGLATQVRQSGGSVELAEDAEEAAPATSERKGGLGIS